MTFAPVATIRKTRPPRWLLGPMAALLLAACTTQIAHRGNMVDIERLTEIVPGQTDKASVSSVLGSPSSVGNFGEDVWYYIGMKTAKQSFLSSEVLEQRVIYIAYGADGRVSSIGELDQADGKRIELVNRETPTAGQRITVL